MLFISLRKQNGFTLIELISVITILGVISATALPKFNTTDLSVTLAANVVKSDIKFAQELAMAREDETSVGIIFTNGATSYTLVDPKGAVTPNGNGVRSLPNGVTISSNATISFNQQGQLASGSDSSIALSGGGKTATLLVTLYTGKVTIS